MLEDSGCFSAAAGAFEGLVSTLAGFAAVGTAGATDDFDTAGTAAGWDATEAIGGWDAAEATTGLGAAEAAARSDVGGIAAGRDAGDAEVSAELDVETFAGFESGVVGWVSVVLEVAVRGGVVAGW
ncbi:hypothetical protein [Winogradskya consettensis]|uniref:hypothetical protein n=1 Tax=Winogradskya consettensis TaxID=113560 RepID=UPI001BB3CDAA|nr:hypothetical protein [Actinoplanes consettensis]